MFSGLDEPVLIRILGLERNSLCQLDDVLMKVNQQILYVV